MIRWTSEHVAVSIVVVPERPTIRGLFVVCRIHSKACRTGIIWRYMASWWYAVQVAIRHAMTYLYRHVVIPHVTE
jgi:hypothetical protein